MKIYTRRGDRGETDLFGGGRVAKDAARVAAYGDVDELTACVGMAAALSEQDDLRELEYSIQNVLYDLGSQLASPSEHHREKAGIPMVTSDDVSFLEAKLDAFDSQLAPLRNFILSGGTPAAAALHVARTVCRRAERSAVALDRDEPLDEFVLRYLNRLSDLFFVMARLENHRAGVEDVVWTARTR